YFDHLKRPQNAQNYRLNCVKAPPPPEVAASAEKAVTALKKHAKPSAQTRDFFIFNFPFFYLLFMFLHFDYTILSLPMSNDFNQKILDFYPFFAGSPQALFFIPFHLSRNALLTTRTTNGGRNDLWGPRKCPTKWDFWGVKQANRYAPLLRQAKQAGMLCLRSRGESRCHYFLPVTPRQS
ncbi:MAG: hypothetical protein IJ959_01910, partial [Clostridia bacterium]|nr:hypothetical protein [Clostridia bacterium]